METLRSTEKLEFRGKMVSDVYNIVHRVYDICHQATLFMPEQDAKQERETVQAVCDKMDECSAMLVKELDRLTVQIREARRFVKEADNEIQG